MSIADSLEAYEFFKSVRRIESKTCLKFDYDEYLALVPIIHGRESELKSQFLLWLES